MNKIAIFCGASAGFSAVYAKAATEAGQFFTKNQVSIIFGGGKVGLMGVIADTMLQEGGEVIGVIPDFLRHEEVEHDRVEQMHVSGSMSERKVMISKMVDAYIALPGGFGTLDEIFEALTLGQLGIEQKPVGLLNTNGFFNPLLAQLDLMVKEGFLRTENRNMLSVSEHIERLWKKMQDYQAPRVSKLIDTTVQSQRVK